MLKKIFQVALCLTALGAFAPPAQTQELPSPFTIEGDWWCRDRSGKTIVRLNIGSIAAGVAPVDGGGVSRPFERAFLISGETNEQIRFDSRRKISGVLTLKDMDEDEDIGQLTVESGVLNSTKTKLKLTCQLQLEDAPPRKVKLLCERLPTSEPDWEGRSTDGRMRGTGLRSDKYDIQITENNKLGFPFFDLLSGGPVRIDGQETPDVMMVGLIGVTPQGKIAAEIGSEQFGNGTAKGKINPAKFEGGRPSLKLAASTDNRPRINTRSTLLDLID